MTRAILALFLALALALVSSAASHADRPYLIKPFGINGRLGVVDGRLIVGLSGEAKAYTDWDLPPGWRSSSAYFSPSDARALSSRFVGYNPKTGAVVLTKSGQGDVECDWKVVQDPDALGLYLQALDGKYKGWYMTVAEEVEKATDCDGKPYTFHHVILTEKPSKRSEWDIEEIGK